MTSATPRTLTRYAPVLAFGTGAIVCLAFWFGIAALATGALRPQGQTVTFAQARDVLFQTARDMTEGRSASRAAR